MLTWTDTVISLCPARPAHRFAGWLNCGETMLCCASKSLQRSEKKPLGSLYYGFFFFFLSLHWIGLLNSQKMEISPAQRVLRSCLLKKNNKLWVFPAFLVFILYQGQPPAPVGLLHGCLEEGAQHPPEEVPWHQVQ